MTFRQLEIFVLAARRLNFGATAKELNVAQPSISQQLRLLEEELGVRLYRKTGQGVAFTEAGVLFAKEAKAILSRIERAKAKLGNIVARGAADSLTVGGSYSPSHTLLPFMLARFKKTHPKVQPQLRTSDRLAVEEMILRGELDLAVINNPPANRHLTMEFYRFEPMVAFVSSRHWLARKKEVNWEDLRQVGFIIRTEQKGRGAARDYVQFLRKQGIRSGVAMRFDTPTAVKEAVRNNSGVGILYRDVVATDIKRGQFKALTMPGDTFKGKSFIIYHKTRPLSPLAREFLELLHTQKDN